ncbi:MAG: DNA polymerase I [Chloroflexi bacterium RBG_13_52_12]|nr:MAG: DNA polymerase I [Chloroflexi bacterium RBG_13_52_12]
MEKPLLVLFDGNAIVHRAYHAFGPTKYRPGQPLTVSKTGEVVSAVYGFALMLLKVLNEIKPTHIAIAFDKKGPTFRHEMFDKYKAQRPPTPDELINQFDRVRQVVKAFNIPLFEIDRYEADDVLGTLSKQASEKDIDTVIVTGDADTMQLVSPHVKVLYPKAGRSFSDTTLFDAAAVKEKFGVGPEHVADYKAMVGDPSDNIPGVPGIGQKTAVKLIQQFGSVEDIFKHLEEVTPPKVKEILQNNEPAAMQSKKLATIVTETPVTLDLDDCRVGKYDRQQAVDLFRELEFLSLLPKLPASDDDSALLTEARPAPPPSGEYRIIASPAELDALVNQLSSTSSFAFDTETTGLNPMTAQIVGISLAVEPGKAFYIPVGHTILDTVTQLLLEQVIERLRPVFEDVRISKTAHNAKFDMMVLAESGITVNGLTSDTMIAAHLLGEKAIGLKSLAFNKLGIEMTPIDSLIGRGAKQISMAQVDIKMASDYAAADADMTLRLASLFNPELERQGLMKLYKDVEMPLVPVLLVMERNGVAVDTSILNEMSRSLTEQVAALEKKIFTETKHEFNINSPQQLGKVLFDEMQLPNDRRGKSRYSTEASVLEELKPVHPVVGYILEYRQLTKMKSTYVDALPALVNPKTGRIHTSFNQTRTTTGRLSSSDPNMQNIPVRGELGGQVRQAFIAAPGHKLLGGDYSQIDLRALAHLSQDEGLVRAFRNDEDIHSSTASQLFGVEQDKVTKDMRRFAKTVNFGVIYGMSEYGLEQATELSREQAGKFIKAYFEKYPGVRKYLDDTKEKARRDGYVETLLGRRRYIPDINSANRQVRESAERMAINMPVQGTSADIIKVAMINLYREMEKRRLKSKMLLQVHDELVFEVPDDELDLMRQLVSDVMDSAVALDVPLKVDTKVGKNWGEMK